MQKFIEFHLPNFEISLMSLSVMDSKKSYFSGMSCTFPMIVDPDDNTQCCHSDQTDFKKCKETGDFFMKNCKFEQLNV